MITSQPPVVATTPADHPPRVGAIDGLTLDRIAPVLLVGLLLLRTALLFVGDGITWGLAAARGFDPGPAMIYANVYIVAVDLITLAVVARLVSRRGAHLRQVVGPIRLRRDMLLALPITIAVIIGFFVATYLGNLIIYAGPPPAAGGTFAPPVWLGIWSISIMPITVAIAEEVLYRGVALHALRARFGAVPAVLITAVFFGLQHAALSTDGLASMAARVITTFLAGLLFAVFAIKLRRLLPIIVAHWVLDVLGLGLPMLLAALAA